jgi:cholesterol oxidase
VRRLSRSIDDIRAHYTVVVVGSGYGGGVAASRLARAGQTVCVLERGRELHPGEYPDTLSEAWRELQLHRPGLDKDSPTGLFDFRITDKVAVLVGCGLGGTSLINAGVVLEPDPRVFDANWPKLLQGRTDADLQLGFDRAREMLKPTPYPDDQGPLLKLEAFEHSASQLGAHVDRPDIAVTFQDGVNHVGVEQHACNGCGDCVTGCNYGAKNTTLMNYLPDSCNFGAEIFCEVSVNSLHRYDGRWQVHYTAIDDERRVFGAKGAVVTADVVVLAAGTLGSTEILLRSRREHGLALSGQLGHRFSGNGDFLGFGYDGQRKVDGERLRVNAVGRGPDRPRPNQHKVGPCITGMIDLRDPEKGGILIQEGVVPGAIGGLLPAAFAAVSGGPLDFARAFSGPYRGPISRTQTYLVMGRERTFGELVLNEEDHLDIMWDPDDDPLYGRIETALRTAARGIEAEYHPNPFWSEPLGYDPLTVHPLGGCAMADHAGAGVVDHQGRVFSGRDGDAVHEGLFVADGSVVPVPLAANPLLTISALAERTCALLAKAKGWTIDYDLPSSPSTPVAPAKPRLRFSERMRGHFARDELSSFKAGEIKGKEGDSPLDLILTILSNDLDEMVTKADHRAKVIGTVVAPKLSREPLQITNGEFQLFDRNPSRVETWNMWYRLDLRSEEGPEYRLEGYKVVHDDRGFDVWGDTTTLHVTMSKVVAGKAMPIGVGIVRVKPADLFRQLTTIEVLGVAGIRKRLGYLAKFGGLFAGTLYDIYARVFTGPSTDEADAISKQRPLRLPPPVVWTLPLPGKRLGVPPKRPTMVRLTRYKGGTKGPVLLAPGFGVSTLSFSTGTIDTNLPEYLVANEYDVWLFDYRASPVLNQSGKRYSVDDIATQDWPTAIEHVRAVTGARDVQVVAHCVGSMSLLMGILSEKVAGVRSIVSSQLTLHAYSSGPVHLRARFRTANIMWYLRIRRLTTNVKRTPLHQFLTGLLRSYAKPGCQNPVCARVFAIYGPSYLHEQLNDATHDAIGAMFGSNNVRAFKQLTRIVRHRQAVDWRGRDVYLKPRENLKRLAIPIHFLSGERNLEFTPECSEKTMALLRDVNGVHLYSRDVVPAYGHMDCFVGRDAAKDIFPGILSHLELTNPPVYEGVAAPGPGI